MKFNLFKKFLLFIPSILLGVLIMVILFPEPSKSQTNFNLVSALPTPGNYSVHQPPSESLKGNLATLSGQVSWRSRIATESSPIKSPQVIQQGEAIEIGDKGTAQVNFEKVGSISIYSKTMLNFSQTLPINLVLALSSGSAKFTKDGSIPISIRALHLLTQIDSGEATITVNSDLHLVTVVINTGSSTLAWTDLDNNTQVINLTIGKKFIFDDDQRKRVN